MLMRMMTGFKNEVLCILFFLIIFETRSQTTEANIPCGSPSGTLITGKVIAGRDARPGAWPWQAILYRDNYLFASAIKPENAYGGGSVISTQWVITAAHIFENSRLKSNLRTKNWRGLLVILGLTNYPKNGENLSDDIFVFEPGMVILHEKYDSNNYNYDVALVKFGKALKRQNKRFVQDTSGVNEIRYGTFVRPVCLPCMDSCYRKRTGAGFSEAACKIYANSIKPLTRPTKADVTVTGFGSTVARDPMSEDFKYPKILQQARLMVLDDDSCQKGLKKVNEVYSSVGHNVVAQYTDQMICAGGVGQHNISDACQGDSGGPLVKKVFSSNKRRSCWTLIGLVSWGLGCAASNDNGGVIPGFYTNVAVLMHWIQGKITEEKPTPTSTTTPTSTRSVFRDNVPNKCPPPVPPNNGYVTENDQNRAVGSVVTHFCNDGYSMRGQSTSSCLQDGTWDLAPICEATRCPAPKVLVNGRAIGNSFHVGARLRYQCNTGFILRGASTSVCVRGGKWTGGERTCTAELCPTPGPFLNGRIIGSKYTAGSLLRFQCNPRYGLIGNAFSICGENSQWTQFPSCEGHCPKPPTPKGGRTVGDDYQVGGVVRTICNGGYTLKGSGFSVCDENGKWDLIPECIIQGCPTPPPLRNGEVIADQYVLGSVSKFRCNPGYKLIGNHMTKCNRNGQWGQYPVCKVRSCPRPEAPDNGSVLGNDYTVGSRIFFECNDGFTLQGDDSSFCEVNEEWGEIPICQVIKRGGVFWGNVDANSCRAPTPPANGYIRDWKEIYKVGDYIVFDCDYGYNIEGNYWTQCISGNSYSWPVPECVKGRSSCIEGCDYIHGALCQCNDGCTSSGNCCGDKYFYCRD